MSAKGFRIKDIGSSNFAFESKYDEGVLAFCRMLKERWGWKAWSWNPTYASWVGTNPVIANEIIARFCIPPENVSFRFRALAQKLHDERTAMLKARAAAERAESLAFWDLCKDYEVKGIKGEMYPYQKAAVVFLMRCGGRGMLAEDPGCGKTLSALGYSTHVGRKKILVVCPASIKPVWMKETRTWTALKPVQVSSSKTLTRSLFSRNDLFVVSYDYARRHHAELNGFEFDQMFIDESHKIKSRDAKQSKSVIRIAAKVGNVITMSGTPIVNRLGDMYMQLKASRPDLVGDWHDFVNVYCGLGKKQVHVKGKDGEHKVRKVLDEVGTQDFDALKRLTREVIFRVRKEDALPWLPEKVFQTIDTELDADTRREYDLAEEEFLEWLRTVKDINKESACALEQINALRQISSRGKLWALREFLKDNMDNDGKVIAFSVYNQPVETLAEELGERSVMLTGKTPNAKRGGLVDSFQTDPEVRVFLGGLVAAGEGITLTAADTVAFLDYSWVPKDHIQGTDRLHRPGQKHQSVRVIQFHSPGTIDDHVREIMESKKAVAERALDGEVASRSVAMQVVMSFAEKAGRVNSGGEVDKSA